MDTSHFVAEGIGESKFRGGMGSTYPVLQSHAPLCLLPFMLPRMVNFDAELLLN